MLSRCSLLLLFISLLSVVGCQTYSSGLQQSIARADETAALSALHAIGVAERTYSVTNGGDYATLKQLADGGFLDVRYAGDKPIKDYIINCKVTSKSSGGSESSFSCNADPNQQHGERTGRHLYIDSSSGNIHWNETQPATASDQVMQ